MTADATMTGPMFCIPPQGSNSSLSTGMSSIIWHIEQAGVFLHTEGGQQANSTSEYRSTMISVSLFAVLPTSIHSFHLPYSIITKKNSRYYSKLNWKKFWHLKDFDHVRYDCYFCSIPLYPNCVAMGFQNSLYFCKNYIEVWSQTIITKKGFNTRSLISWNI